MEELEKKIEQTLTTQLPGVQVRFDPYPGYGKLHATIVWDQFDEHSIMERQRRVHTLLKSVLTEEQRDKTGFLLTVTPTEINAMQEAPVAA